MIIAPHAGFAAGNLSSGRNIVPAIRAMIDRVEQQTLVRRSQPQIAVTQERPQCGQSSLPITSALRSRVPEVVAQTQQTLHPDGGGRTVDRLVFIKWIRFAGSPFSQFMK